LNTLPAPLAARLAALLAPELDPAYRRRVATVVEWLPPSGADDACLVDIGCGRGYFLHYYAELGQRAMVGVEFDAPTAALARRAHEGRRGVTIVRGDARRLPLPDATCSGAILSEVIEHVDDDVAVLREAWRVLRPGSVAAITVPHARYPWLWDPLNRTLATLRLPPLRRGPLAGIWAGHRRLYEIDGLRRAVTAAGFAIDEERAFVRYCLPFAHNLFYGIGKPLLDSGWLPASLGATIDRHRAPERSSDSSPLTRALHALCNVGERWNREHEGFAVASVNLAIKARKPA
jgi:SAM-dependent methyltransferase